MFSIPRSYFYFFVLVWQFRSGLSFIQDQIISNICILIYNCFTKKEIDGAKYVHAAADEIRAGQGQQMF